jgi:hypothetical protein
MLRNLLVERPSSDVKVSRDLMVVTASRHEVSPGLTYLDFVKQILPVWLLAPDQLSPTQREFVAHGIAFGKHFLNSEIRLHLPTLEHFAGEKPEVLGTTRTLLSQVITLRREVGDDWERFSEAVKPVMSVLGKKKGPALHRLRLIVGQEQGLPATRFLFALPLDYLQLVETLLSLYMQANDVCADSKVAQANGFSAGVTAHADALAFSRTLSAVA